MTHSRSVFVTCLIFGALCVAMPVLHSQQPPGFPHSGYVYPAGAEKGTTVDVRVGGQFLDGATSVIVSGKGVHAAVTGFDKPLTAKEVQDLRDHVQELQKQTSTPALARELAEIRLKIGDTQRRNANPSLAQAVLAKVTVDADAEPGSRQVRVVTPLGVSNPVVFQVGQLPEVLETSNKTKADVEQTISLPAVINGRLIPGDVDRLRAPLVQPGQYQPGDVDRYRFHARKGADLVAVVSARDLMPYLADAVPGWLQATAALYDAAGREIAYEDDYRFHPDPVLHCRIPADGEYVLEIRDALSRGREDFVYRVAIGELPFITSVFPLGGPAGSTMSAEVAGWNLPASTVAIDARDEGAGVVYASMRSGSGLISNRLPFQIGGLPERIEHEPNDSLKSAETIKLPIVINGRIDRPGDWDVFAFSGKAGDRVVAEVTARRLESPIDSVVELTDESGRVVAKNDDREDKGSGLLTHHADSYVLATLPAAGKYFVRIGDVQHKGGPEYGYRLRVSAPRPDFELRVSPAEINATGGGTVPVTVTAIRQDGFDGDIAVALHGPAQGYLLSGALIPSGQDHVRLTVTVPPAATTEPIAVTVEGGATIDGRKIARTAVPSEDMMQAFAYRHLVPTDAERISITGRGAVRVPSRLVTGAPAKLAPGGTVEVRAVVAPAFQTFQNVQFELVDPPEGLTLVTGTLEPTGVRLVIRADPAKVKPGLRGNLIVTMTGERVPPPNAQGAQPRRRVELGTLPAVAFEIVR